MLAGVVLCFGGGILLSTVLLHMLGEVRESLERATELGMIPQTTEYPFAELLVGMGKYGFFMFYIKVSTFNLQDFC